jgi:hypothetical protein
MTDPTETYRQIAQILFDAIPGSWDEATTQVEIARYSAKHVTIYRRTDATTGQVFVEDAVEPIVRQLQADMANAWRGRKWHVFKLTLKSSGQFSADFGYDKPKWVLEAEELGKNERGTAP